MESKRLVNQGHIYISKCIWVLHFEEYKDLLKSLKYPQNQLSISSPTTNSTYY